MDFKERNLSKIYWIHWIFFEIRQKSFKKSTQIMMRIMSQNNLQMYFYRLLLWLDINVKKVMLYRRSFCSLVNFQLELSNQIKQFRILFKLHTTQIPSDSTQQCNCMLWRTSDKYWSWVVPFCTNKVKFEKNVRLRNFSFFSTRLWS